MALASLMLLLGSVSQGRPIMDCSKDERRTEKGRNSLKKVA